MRAAILATCTLNQWAMDFTGNFQRILESIKQAKGKEAGYRTGPELEVTGYSCGDHFYESDTFLHSWEVVAELLKHEECQNIIIDVGMPVMHKNVAYNCRVIILNKKILLIRPKKKLCDNGIYHETRWFTGWTKHQTVEEFYLPKIVQDISNQRTTLIGDAVIRTEDTCIGFEICEELWNPESSNIYHFYDGVEIMVNSSGGFHEIGKTKIAMDVIKTATAKCGGVYLFSNLRGCDGERMFFHGTSHVTCNGKIISIGKQFSLKDVEVVTAAVDLDDVTTYRKHIRRSTSMTDSHPVIEANFAITTQNFSILATPHCSELNCYKEGEEIALGPACWLWDYLRRSGLNGLFLSLDGDVDSSSNAVIAYSMCNLVFQSIAEGDAIVLSDLRKIVNDTQYMPESPKDICKALFVTCHMESGSCSSKMCEKSEKLAKEINSNHLKIPLYCIINTFIMILSFIIGVKLDKKTSSSDEKSALNELKEQVKLTIAYLIAKLFLSSKGKFGSLLVLGSGNADKFMSGNFVKYGSSYGDISLTGGIRESDLENFLRFSITHFKLNSLKIILNMPCVEIPEKTIFCKSLCTLKEVELFSSLRKEGCGPYSAFFQIAGKRGEKIDLDEIFERVKNFFSLYSDHHHKLFAIPPCFHFGSYASVNANYDQRQILYSTQWTWQFQAIENEIKNLKHRNRNDLCV
ncbi:glutamine-dependent NAD(+) synthetase-like [Uloborus diversus]|uniref:glutamine-dependent NAD(+) synthetase-like n=1 Tax=Uloborus diversus TaxID=327109 RepID=UPI00240A3E1D|nr:glutamine-dependent NAD(+) synthetase-like [Uloborus diversus]